MLIETPEYLKLSRAQREMLDDLQKGAFNYFVDLANPQNGLVADSLVENSPSSIAAIGFSLPAYIIIGVEHGWLRRKEAVERTLTVLRFFSNFENAPNASLVGHSKRLCMGADETPSKHILRVETSRFLDINKSYPRSLVKWLLIGSQ